MALSNTTYDDVTGLPALPDGLMWRVSEEPASIFNDYKGSIWVGIVKPTVIHAFEFLWIKAQPETRYPVYRNLFGTLDGVTPMDVLESAEDVFLRYRELVDKEQAIQDIVGLYPPKSIL